jgi:hypothetical protein
MNKGENVINRLPQAWVVGGYSQVYIKSPEGSTPKITVNGYLLVSAENILGNEGHEKRMNIKNMS